VQVVSNTEALLAPHVSPMLDLELLSRDVEEKLHRFSSEWSPPLAIDQWSSRTLSIDGLGWRHVAGDVVIPGLGFVAVTGSGVITLEVLAPREIDLHTRRSWIETTPNAVKWPQ
jgi:hypothetical protein